WPHPQRKRDYCASSVRVASKKLTGCDGVIGVTASPIGGFGRRFPFQGGPMFLNTANLKHHVTAANRGRYALNAIALTRRGTLSSDGHCLLFVPYPEVSAKDAPKIDGVNSKAKPPNLALLDPADAAKAASMVSGKGRKSNQPVFEL